MTDAVRRWGRSAGLFAGPACWAINTQTAYSVASQACTVQRAILMPTMLVLIAVSVAAALLSVFSARSVSGEWFESGGGMASRFRGAIGLLSRILVAVVKAAQVRALLLLER